MVTQLQTKTSPQTLQPTARAAARDRVVPPFGRLVQIGLALYLLPVLAVVLVVSGIGILIVASAQTVSGIFASLGSLGRKPLDRGRSGHDRVQH